MSRSQADFEHFSPAGHGTGQAEIQKIQGGQRVDGAGYGERKKCHQGGHRVGQNMTEDNAGRTGAQQAYRGHIIARLFFERRGAKEGRVARPGKCDQNQQEQPDPHRHGDIRWYQSDGNNDNV